MTRIKVREITGREILAGKSDGLRDFPKFMTAVEEMSAGDTVILDWTGIEIATASYFGATLISLLRMAIAGDLDRYFVVAGLNSTCLDELKLVLDLQSLVTLAGEWRDGTLQGLTVLGKLDDAYSEALDAVQQVDAVSAAELHKSHQRSSPIGKTGWINRLTNLHRLRLVRKQRIGREYVFQAVNKRRKHGSRLDT